MKPKVRKILEAAIESGIEHGYAKAHKHSDVPSESHICGTVEHYIWLYIDEVFSFEDESYEQGDEDVP